MNRMKKITEKAIRSAVAALCIEANTLLRRDVKAALEKAVENETDDRPRGILRQLLLNADAAKNERLAICQDTGMPVVFVEIGRDVNLAGVDIAGAINQGLADGYKRGYFRDSIIADPILRGGASGFTPGILHFDFTAGRGVKITVLPKGFGCENKSKLKMFNPTVRLEEIEDFIVSSVAEAGPDACPPYILGVGIGGTADHAAMLSKKAFLRPLGKASRVPHVAQLEKRLFERVNALNLGPMGLGGKTTVLGVSILTYPTHIAGLPVAVNFSCHALRSATALLS